MMWDRNKNSERGGALKAREGITLKTEIALSRSQRREPGKKDFHIHDIGEVYLEDGREEVHGRAADAEIFHRQDADEGGGINRVFAVRDSLRLQNGVVGLARRVRKGRLERLLFE